MIPYAERGKMPIRFRKTLKVFPGVKLNISKHGVSTTVGGRGMHLTFNRYGVRQDLGLPGTGLSEASYIIGRNKGKDGNKAADPEEEAARHVQSIHHGEGKSCQMPGCGCLVVLLLVAGVVIYFGANALNLHPAAFLSNVISQILHSLRP